MHLTAIRVPLENGAGLVGRMPGDRGAAEIPVDNRAIFQYQIHRCLSTLLRLFIPFLLRFLRRRVDSLIVLVIPSGVVLQIGTLSLV
jgi:hypothetical protein